MGKILQLSKSIKHPGNEVYWTKEVILRTCVVRSYIQGKILRLFGYNNLLVWFDETWKNEDTYISTDPQRKES